MPILFSGKYISLFSDDEQSTIGPYSFDAAPVEKIFATIKHRDLNPLGRSFQSRSGAETYLLWLAEAISDLSFGDVVGYFRHALQASRRYLLFEDI